MTTDTTASCPPPTGAPLSRRRRQLMRIGAAVSGALAVGGVAEAVEPQRSPSGSDVVPFKAAVPQAALDDLRYRLQHTRWPDAEPVKDWTQGVPLASARALVDTWLHHYDWRQFERKLNTYPQYLTRIDGLAIHFIHVRSRHANALPLLLTHGWPGSFVEFLKLIEPLTNPTAFGGSAEEAFDVVIPSLPGYGFSGKPTETGWDALRTAKAWTVLMQRLGYAQWVAQGGDWGAAVTTVLGHLQPPGLLGIHLNWQFVFPEKLGTDLSAEEQRAVTAAAEFSTDGYGYFHIQATRPQTIGYGLADSPAGLASWVYEKFHAWTDRSGKSGEALRVTEMLDDISLYWFTNSAASSARFYWENRHNASFSGGKLSLPVAVSVFPHEIYRAPKSWVQQTFSNLIYFNELDQGGHFAAFEQPQIFAQELRKGFAALRPAGATP